MRYPRATRDAEPEGIFRDIAPPSPRAAERPAYVVTLRPEPGVNDTRAMRAFLKAALRRFGLRCIGISQK